MYICIVIFYIHESISKISILRFFSLIKIPFQTTRILWFFSFLKATWYAGKKNPFSNNIFSWLYPWIVGEMNWFNPFALPASLLLFTNLVSIEQKNTNQQVNLNSFQLKKLKLSVCVCVYEVDSKNCLGDLICSWL